MIRTDQQVHFIFFSYAKKIVNVAFPSATIVIAAAVFNNDLL